MKDETRDDLEQGVAEPDPEPVLQPSDPRYWERALSAAGAGGASASYLLQDPDVSAAISSGKPGRVYQVFTRKHAAAKAEADRSALAAVLANRRLFLEPTAAGPAMWTMNGCGTRCYGSQERSSEDGTYITTLFVAAVFVPVWPLRQYLVADAEKGGWYFLGRVPTSSFHGWWRRLVLFGAAAVAVVVGLLLWNRTTHDDVHFVSGLPFPVTVAMGEHEVTVEPGRRATHEFEAGEYHIVARRTDDGLVLEETDAVVPGGSDMVAYNVLGSAPLYLQVVAYAGKDVPPEEAAAKESVRSLAGRSWVTLDDVDHVFEETPDRIDLGRSERVSTRSCAGALSAGTWLEAANHLASDGDMARAAELARHVTLLDPTDVQAHRIYQTHMQASGGIEEIRATYRAAYAADPTSARAGYLCARIAPFAEALPIYEALLPANPDDPWLLRGASYVYYQEGRFEEAVPLLEDYLALRSSEAATFVPMLARALAGAGRPQDALETVSGLLGVEGLGGSNPYVLISLYASLRRMLPDVSSSTIDEHWRPFVDGAPAAALVAETAALGRDTETVERLRGSLQDAESVRYCDMLLLSRSDVAAAAQLALGAAPETLRRMDDAAQVAIACELARTGRREKAVQVLGGLFSQSAEILGIEQIDALPDVSGLSEDLDITLRAAMLVAASRRTDDAARKARLLARARHLDMLREVVPD